MEIRERLHKWISGGQSARPSFPGSGPYADNRITRAARSPSQSTLDEDIVNRGVRFRQRAPAPAATRDETWQAGRPANRQDQADFAARQSPAQTVMEPCRSAKLLLPSRFRNGLCVVWTDASSQTGPLLEKSGTFRFNHAFP